jgi:glutathione S-transferase fosA5
MKRSSMIRGINHITFAVRNLDVSFQFYAEVLGLKPLARWHQGAYFLAGDSWVCLNQDTSTRNRPLPEYTHTAFAVQEDEFESVSERIEQFGAELWNENRSEGKSLYFLDPDSHKFEIHAGDWRSRIAACREKPYPGMVFFD